MEKIPSKPQNEEEYESDYQHLTKFLQDSYKLYLKHQAKTQISSRKAPKEHGVNNRTQSRQSQFSSANELGEFFELPPHPSAKNRQHETTTKLSYKATQLLYEILSDREAYEGQFLSNQSIDNIASLKQDNQTNLLECLKFALTVKSLSPTQTKEFVGQFVNNVMQGEKLLSKFLNLENLGQFVPSKNLVEGLGQESSQENNTNNQQQDEQRIMVSKNDNGNANNIWSSNVQERSSVTSGKENIASNQQFKAERTLPKAGQIYTGNQVYLDVPNYQQAQSNRYADQDLNTQNIDLSQNITPKFIGKTMQTSLPSLQKSPPNLNSRPNLDNSYNENTINSSLKNFANSEREQASKINDPYHTAKQSQQKNNADGFQKSISDIQHPAQQVYNRSAGFGSNLNQKLKEMKSINGRSKSKSLGKNKADMLNSQRDESYNDSQLAESKIASMPNFQKQGKKQRGHKSSRTNDSNTNEDTEASTENKFQGFRKNTLGTGYQIQVPESTHQESTSTDNPYLRAYQLSKQRSKYGQTSGLGSTRPDQALEESYKNNQKAANKNFLTKFKSVLRNTNQSINSTRRDDVQSPEYEYNQFVHDTANTQRENQILEFLQSRKHGGQVDRNFDINSRLVNSQNGMNQEDISRTGQGRFHQTEQNLHTNKKQQEPSNQLQSQKKPGGVFKKLFKRNTDKGSGSLR